MPWIVVDGGSR